MQEYSFDEFFENYKKKIVPQLDEIEKIRLEECKVAKKEKTNSLIWILVILPFLIIFLNLCIGNPQDKFIMPSLILGMGILLLIWNIFDIHNVHNKNFKFKLKGKFLKEILKPFGNIRWRNFSTPMDKQGICESGLFFMISNLNPPKIVSDDEFVGKYKDVSFRIAQNEIWLDTSDSIPALRSFKGIIIEFIFNKNIKNKTTILSKNDGWVFFENKLMPLISLFAIIATIIAIIVFLCKGADYGHLDLYAINPYLLNLSIFTFFIIFFSCIFLYLYTKKQSQKINLEDLKFDKRFRVYSSDEVEARYLVTPLFMELLNNLKTAFGVKNLKCSFFDDKLMIAISTNKDLFEIGDLFTSAHNPKFILQFYRELVSIYKMIEYFKLNEKNFVSK